MGNLTFRVPVGDFGSLATRVIDIFSERFGILLVVFAPFEDLFRYIDESVSGIVRRREKLETRAGRNAPTFLRTAAETLGRGIG